jgi:AcrR family transcriptional regulator
MTVRRTGLGDGRSPACAKTQEAVIETAFELCCHRGYQGVRVAEIAREAGISRATFYTYFAYREEVLAVLVTRLIGNGEAVPEIEKAARVEGLDTTGRIEAVAEAIVASMLQQEQLARCVYRLPVRIEGLLGGQWEERSAFRYIDQVLDDAADDGELRDDIQREVIRAQLHSAIDSAMRHWASGGGAAPYQRMRHHLQLAMHGAVAPDAPSASGSA